MRNLTICLLSFAISVLSLMTSSHAKPAAELIGIAVANDGGSVLFGKVEISLFGIAAPRVRGDWNVDEGGFQSARALHSLVDRKEVRCELDGTLSPVRRVPVAKCYLGEMDIALQQVLNGHARDCPRHSGGAYALAEGKARSRKKDLSKIYSLPKFCE